MAIVARHYAWEARQREALEAARAENANLSAIDSLLQVLRDPATRPGKREKLARFLAPYLEYRMVRSKGQLTLGDLLGRAPTGADPR
jgi:hypothetical protein